ncbi:MAG: hypothetical protein K6F00_00045 [Lachnospiraceae bacterium]|nr:hypothetical protein [Lachnospiraceae bacterium]
MKTLYLHVGTPKTGTTAIQNFLGDNKSKLKELGVCYPKFKTHYKRARSVRNGHWLCRGIASEEEYDEFMNTLFSEAEKYPKLVMTDEGLWNFNHDEDFWKNLKKTLEEHDICLKVIVYFRRQDSYAFSYWGQKVKELSYFYYTFSEYIYSGEYLEKSELDYTKVLNHVAESIGKENIIVRPYEKDQYEGSRGDILSDFLKILGVEWQDDFKMVKRHNNVSMADSVLEAKRLMNTVKAFRKKNVTLRLYLERIQDELEAEGKLGRRTGVDARFRKRLLNKFKECNEYIAREYLGREDGILFREQIKTYDNELDTFKRSELEEIYRRLLDYNDADKKRVFERADLQGITEKALKRFDKEAEREKKIKRKIVVMARRLGMIDIPYK